MAKRIGCILKETTAKKQIDRFFETCRKKFNIYAFQNESILKYELLKKLDIPILVTLQAKRNFFIEGSDYKLVNEGFIIEYYHFTNELLKKIKDEIMFYFRKKFFIRFPKEDLRNKDKELFSGRIIIKNWEEKSND